MNSHIIVCKSGYFQIHNLGKCCSSLKMHAVRTLSDHRYFQAFTKSAKSFMYGAREVDLPGLSIAKFLRSLHHWLPIKKTIVFNKFLFVYRSFQWQFPSLLLFCQSYIVYTDGLGGHRLLLFRFQPASCFKLQREGLRTAHSLLLSLLGNNQPCDIRETRYYCDIQAQIQLTHFLACD